MKQLRNNLIIALVILFVTGCVPYSRPDLSIYKPPLVNRQGCLITVIRASQFVGYFGSFYIDLDGVDVARLESGEYTKFLVQQGLHTIGASWRSKVILHDVFTGFPFDPQGEMEIYKQVEIECRDGENYSFGLKCVFALSIKDRTQLQQLTDFKEDFRFDDKVFVPAGPSEKK